MSLKVASYCQILVVSLTSVLLLPLRCFVLCLCTCLHTVLCLWLRSEVGSLPQAIHQCGAPCPALLLGIARKGCQCRHANFLAPWKLLSRGRRVQKNMVVGERRAMTVRKGTLRREESIAAAAAGRRRIRREADLVEEAGMVAGSAASHWKN